MIILLRYLQRRCHKKPKTWDRNNASSTNIFKVKYNTQRFQLLVLLLSQSTFKFMWIEGSLWRCDNLHKTLTVACSTSSVFVNSFWCKFTPISHMTLKKRPLLSGEVTRRNRFETEFLMFVAGSTLRKRLRRDFDVTLSRTTWRIAI